MVNVTKVLAKGISFQVSINAQDIINFEARLKYFREVIGNTVKELGDTGKNLWISNVQISLKSSANYITAIEEGVKYPFDGDNFHYQLYPEYKKKVKGRDADIIKIVEFGIEPYDMKDRYLHGKKFKVIKFDYARAFGGKTESGVRELPIYMNDIMRALGDRPFTVKNAGKIVNDNIMNPRLSFSNPDSTKNFSVLNAKPGNFTNPALKKQIQPNLSLEINYAWKTGKYTGLQQNKKSPGVMSNYRTLSINSAPGSWIHPGMIPKKVFERAMNELSPMIRPAFIKALQAVFQ